MKLKAQRSTFLINFRNTTNENITVVEKQLEAFRAQNLTEENNDSCTNVEPPYAISSNQTRNLYSTNKLTHSIRYPPQTQSNILKFQTQLNTSVKNDSLMLKTSSSEISKLQKIISGRSSTALQASNFITMSNTVSSFESQNMESSVLGTHIIHECESYTSNSMVSDFDSELTNGKNKLDKTANPFRKGTLTVQVGPFNQADTVVFSKKKPPINTKKQETSNTGNIFWKRWKEIQKNKLKAVPKMLQVF